MRIFAFVFARLTSRFDASICLPDPSHKRQGYKLRGSSAAIVGKEEAEEGACKDFETTDTTDTYCVKVYTGCCSPTLTDDTKKYKDLCDWLGFDNHKGIVGDTPWAFSTEDPVNCDHEKRAMEDQIAEEEEANKTTVPTTPPEDPEVSSSRSMRFFAFICARLTSRFDAFICLRKEGDRANHSS